MRPSSKYAIALISGVAALAVALPALGQQSPQSILPPGFGAPPAPQPEPAQPSGPAQLYGNVQAPDTGEVPNLPLSPDVAVDNAASAQADEDNAANEAEAAAEALRKQDLPEFARRSNQHLGFLSPDVTGIARDGFGTTHGRFLATLMARLDAPVASRWVSMLLRRVLTTDIDTPGGVSMSLAERALLLARMGEADAARLMVQSFDYDNATPRYYQAVMEAAMASADPSALCPVADKAEAADPNPGWPLARAMCAGLSGENGTASALFDRARSLPGAANGIDLTLAQRVIGAGTGARRAVDVQWQGVYDLTSWRFGLASAVGLEVPPDLIGGASLAKRAWFARAPMISQEARLGSARIAASLGVLSSADLVDFVSAMAEGSDPYATGDTPAGRLRAAYASRDESDRLTALRALWTGSETERDQYAARILTARAAERIRPSADHSSDARALIAAMLSAGLDVQAARWADVVRGMSGTDGDEAWALLAVGAPARVVDASADRIADFGSGGRGSAQLRAQFLFASLAALGRISGNDVVSLSQKLGVPIGARSSWTRAIDAAAARNEPATVALIAAVGMQTTDWAQVSPVFLYHIIAALRSVGFEAQARMVAAEAISRT